MLSANIFVKEHTGMIPVAALALFLTRYLVKMDLNKPVLFNVIEQIVNFPVILVILTYL